MSGLFDQITNYSPPLLTAGQVNYKGTWSAAANSPTLVDPPAATSKGDYYVVSAAGTQFSISFAVGDWIISNGTAWEKVDLTDAVSSVFGRTGAVVGASTDYSSVGLTNTAIGASSPSTGAFTTVTASSTIAATGAVTGSNLSGTNTGDQTITLTGGVTGSGTGSFAATVVTNANLTGAITSVGNATSLGSFSSANLSAALTDETGSGAAVFATSPTLVTPILGTPSSGTLSSCTGLPISTGVSGLGTGIATALAVNTGSAGAPVLFNGALGTPTSGTVTNLTGTASININGTVGGTTANTGAFTTLSASGTITKNNTAATNSLAFFSSGSTTGAVYTNLGNTGNNIYAGVETSAGNTFVIGSTAYDAFITDVNGVGLTVGVGQSKIGRFSSTGLAVTGALSSTGNYNVSAGFKLTQNTNAYVTPEDNVRGAVLAGTGAAYLMAGGSVIAGATSTGLAVTGALSSTGVMIANGTSVGGFGGQSPISALYQVSVVNTDQDGGTQVLYGTSTYAINKGAATVYGFKYNTAGDYVTAGRVRVAKENSTDGNYSGYLAFDTRLNGSGLSEKVRIDSSGNVGIGTTNPTAKIYAVTAANSQGLVITDNTSSDFEVKVGVSTGVVRVGSPSGAMSFSTVNTERARIDSSGNLLVGMTGTPSGTPSDPVGVCIFGASATGATVLTRDSLNHVLYVNNKTSSGGLVNFFNGGNTVGSITSNGTITIYNTTSDYRLKDITGPLTDSGAFIDALKPKVGTWKSNGSKFAGFLAHEFAEVSPSSVSGEKDAVDEEGKPKYQSMQASSAEVIANLVAELQSLRQRVAALESN
jgi:hypothetical protein